MGKDQLPTAKDRRRLMTQKANGLAEIGGRFLKEGRWGEALECLAAAGDQAGLDDLAQQALAAGDLFTWRRAGEVLGREISAEDLLRLKTRAEDLGKHAFGRAAQALLEPAERNEP